eukprot:TRINITY_DN8163_c0_g2_i2.p1 TRINITY_DN8163_c0_g2~~TRINITY_DN8163_c0_g2_i2.p1  ORF type:complete len:449 (-),score=30.60 TRINITY_DN8163_c0_g2_i2:286-1632(-)
MRQIPEMFGHGTIQYLSSTRTQVKGLVTAAHISFFPRLQILLCGVYMQKTKIREETGVDTGMLNIWRRRFDYKKNQTYYYNGYLNTTKTELDDEEKQLLEKPAPDTYNTTAVMPLLEFIRHPISNLLHNGATHQILGLSNNTHWVKDYAELGDCLLGDVWTQKDLLKFAKRRIERFLFTGIKEREEESLGVLISELGLSWNRTAYKVASQDAIDYSEEIQPRMGASETAIKVLADIQQIREKINDVYNTLVRNKRGGKHEEQAEQLSLIQDYKREISQLQQKLFDEGGEGTAARQVKPDRVFRSQDDLATAYHKCVSKAGQKSQGKRENSLRFLITANGEYVTFSGQHRSQIDPFIIAEIRRRNWMDVQLYEHANMVLDMDIERLNDTDSFLALPPAPSNFRRSIIQRNINWPVFNAENKRTGQFRHVQVTLDAPSRRHVVENKHVEL